MRNIDILSFSDRWRGAYSCGALFRYTKHKQLRPNALKVLNCRKREAKSRLTVGSDRWSGWRESDTHFAQTHWTGGANRAGLQTISHPLELHTKLRTKESALRKPAPGCTVSSVPVRRTGSA